MKKPNHYTLKPSFWVLSLSLLLAACQENNTKPLSNSPADKLLIGLASPIILQAEKTTILLQDYFLEPTEIDSVLYPQHLNGILSANKDTLTITSHPDLTPINTIRFYAKDRFRDIMVKASKKKEITLTLTDKQYNQVAIKGEMNAWNPQLGKMSKEKNVWSISFHLNPGNYAYLFVTDNSEIRDPQNKLTTFDGMGNQNSLLSVPGPDPKKLPTIFLKESEEEKITIGTTNNPSAIVALWENQRLQAVKDSMDFHLYVPKEATEAARSFIRILGYNNEGLSNDVLIPLQFGRVIESREQLKRTDWEAQIMYFTLVDRFNNGDPENDRPVNDPRLNEKTNYAGGDLQGIIQKIKDGYFKNLNINSIWLSPITQNPTDAYQEFPEPRRWYSGYHGYWPISSSKVDYRFGSNQQLKQLVEIAHENNINVLLDYVCNHIHIQHPIFKKHPDWVTPFELQDGRKNLRLWDEERLTTWFDEFIPSLDLSRPEVIEVQSDSTLFWLENFPIDGYRHDATKHIPEAFWRTLTKKIKKKIIIEQNRPIFQIGETYGSRPLTQSYISSGMLDAQFDFNLYFDAREAFAKPESSLQKLAHSLSESLNYYGHHSTMGNISGNHDQARFTSLAGGGLGFEEDQRDAAFSKNVGVGDDVGYQRLLLLQAFNFSIPGIPVIYYGDEIGMPGAGDPDSRRPMKFDNLSTMEQKTLNLTSKLTNLRKNRLSLLYGETEILHQSDNTLVIGRYWMNEMTITAINKGIAPETISFSVPDRFTDTPVSSNFNSTFTKENNRISITLPPVNFDILTNSPEN